jgi:hypothetical protein
MTYVPLVTIPEERSRQELRRAVQHATPSRRFLWLALFCSAWLLLGLFLLGLSFHLANPDIAQVVFLVGILVGNGGPAWTLIIFFWLEQQR